MEFDILIYILEFFGKQRSSTISLIGRRFRGQSRRLDVLNFIDFSDVTSCTTAFQVVKFEPFDDMNKDCIAQYCAVSLEFFIFCNDSLGRTHKS